MCFTISHNCIWFWLYYYTKTHMIKTHKHQSSCQINLGISYVRIRLHKGQQKVQHEVIYIRANH